MFGGVAGGLSLSKASVAKGMCADDECPASAQPKIDSAMLLANVSNVGFGVGLAGVVLGVVGVVVSRKAPPPAAARAFTVRRIVGAGYAGLRGAF